MKNNRILSYHMSQKLTDTELLAISASGMSNYGTANGSYTSQAGFDTAVDVTIDI